MYRVLSAFRDLKDGGYQYGAGDEYPRAGLAPEAGRVAELLSGSTRTLEPGKPLIEEAAAESATTAEEAPTGAGQPKKEGEKPKPKRGKRKSDD